MKFGKIIASVVWCVIGFVLWLPLLVRVISFYVASVVAATYSRRDARPAERALHHAMGFYSNGFKQIWPGHVAVQGGDDISEPWNWAEIGKELIWAVLFWFGTLFFVISAFSKLQQARIVATPQLDAANVAAQTMIESERTARKAAENATEQSKAAQSFAERQLQEVKAQLKHESSDAKTSIRTDGPIALDKTVRELHSSLELEKVAHQASEQKFERENAMRILAENKIKEVQTSFDRMSASSIQEQAMKEKFIKEQFSSGNYKEIMDLGRPGSKIMLIWGPSNNEQGWTCVLVPASLAVELKKSLKR